MQNEQLATIAVLGGTGSFLPNLTASAVLLFGELNALMPITAKPLRHIPSTSLSGLPELLTISGTSAAMKVAPWARGW